MAKYFRITRLRTGCGLLLRTPPCTPAATTAVQTVWVLMGNEFTHWFANTNHILALANVVVALVAVVAIIFSGKVAKASEKTIEIAGEQIGLGQATLEQERATLLASVRPVIVEVPLGVYRTEGRKEGNILYPTVDEGRVEFDIDRDHSFSIMIPVRNIGTGPAFVHSAMITSNPGSLTTAFVDHQAVPQGELAHVSLDVPSDDPFHQAVVNVHLTGGLAAMIRYFDVGGVQRTQSVVRVSVRKPDEQEWSQRIAYVRQVELFRCDDNWIPEDAPFITTNPR